MSITIRTIALTTLLLGLPAATHAAPPQPAAKTQPAPTTAKSDGSVTQGARALAEAITGGFRSLGRAEAFHRIAVPYFKESGKDAEERHLGRLVAEVLAVELARRRRTAGASASIR